jgi:hypothetical protein
MNDGRREGREVEVAVYSRTPSPRQACICAIERCQWDVLQDETRVGAVPCPFIVVEIEANRQRTSIKSPMTNGHPSFGALHSFGSNKSNSLPNVKKFANSELR